MIVSYKFRNCKIVIRKIIVIKGIESFRQSSSLNQNADILVILSSAVYVVFVDEINP